ncbi:unnamed protein product, partial [Ixodes pacificus]
SPTSVGGLVIWGAPPNVSGSFLARRKRSKRSTSSLGVALGRAGRRLPVGAQSSFYSTFQPGLLVIPRAFEAGFSVRRGTEGFGLSCGAHQSVVDLGSWPLCRNFHAASSWANPLGDDLSCSRRP